MTAISDRQLARMRDQVAARLPQTATIQRVEQASDGAGGWTEQVVTVGTAACRLDPLSKQVQIGLATDVEALTVRYQLTLPYDAALDTNTQVTVEGRTYQVVQMDVDHAWRVSRRAVVSEVR